QRTDQIGFQPARAELGLAGGDAGGQPVVPGLDQRLGQTAADEIAAAGQLAVEAGRRHSRSGSWKLLSTRLLNGLKALLARSSLEMLAPSTRRRRVKRSGVLPADSSD